MKIKSDYFSVKDYDEMKAIDKLIYILGSLIDIKEFAAAFENHMYDFCNGCERHYEDECVCYDYDYDYDSHKDSQLEEKVNEPSSSSDNGSE